MEEIYKAEYLEIKLKILKDTIKDLEKILYSKIHKNSNTYKELNTYINLLIQEEFIYERELNLSDKFYLENTISKIKVKTNVLDSLFKIKKTFKCHSISETLELLLEYYLEDKYFNELNEIKECNISVNLAKNLNKSFFYICECKNIDNKVIYFIDDVIIKDNIKYLDLRKFKSFKKANFDEYLFSPKFNLEDLENFYKILIKSLYNNK